jgi:metallo-beta-lactamase class B
MRERARGLLVAAGLAVAFGEVTPVGQVGTAETHIAAAKAAAGTDHAFMFETLCVQALAGLNQPAAPPAVAAQGRGAQPAGPPARATWYAEPVKAFDNLYFVGQTEFSAWAITTSAGIIVIDTIFDYSVNDEVIEGLRKVGLDPATIKYAIVSHGHGDHSGGAKALQDRFGTKIILSADDWDLLDRSTGTKPRRDIVATDGQKLTLGDTTITLYLTPGHTKGTISTIIPVKDRGQPHVAAYWGGTMFNWIRNRASYITPTTPDKYWFDIYAGSAARFRDIAARAGADVLLSNHTNYDGTKQKIPQLATRKAGDPNPYVVGTGAVQRYLTTVGECAQAGSIMSR